MPHIRIDTLTEILYRKFLPNAAGALQPTLQRKLPDNDKLGLAVDIANGVYLVVDKVVQCFLWEVTGMVVMLIILGVV